MLKTPDQIRILQRKLYRKAKQEANFRFYSLYDKVYREDILRHSYHLVKANKGSPGIDGMTFEAIEEKEGEEFFLAKLKEELECKSYKAQPVRRVYIPKPDGSKRPLGIPTIRDRIVQMAVKLVIEPIFEADFCNNSYGFRPKRSAHDAVNDIADALHTGHTKVIDADISKYFDTIPHNNLMKVVTKRIVDKEILHLIKMWLKAPVVEEENGKRRYTGGKKNRKGTPQGGVISPLLANIYLHLMDKVWEINQFAQKMGAHLVRYADDFVILCKWNTTKAMEAMKHILKRLDLTLNENKTHVVDATKASFDFLGFEIRMRNSRKSKKKYTHVQPSKKSLEKIKGEITSMTNRKLTVIPIKDIIKNLNMTLRGWANYFHYRNCSESLGKIKQHAQERIRTHLRKRHKIRDRKTGYLKFPDKRLYTDYKLYKIPTTAGWTKANALR